MGSFLSGLLANRKFHKVNTVFLTSTPLIVLVGVPLYLWYVGISWGLLALTAVYAVATSVSITGGYHRLFAHRTYEASWPVRMFYLLFGAGAVQGSVLTWCSDHRRHHLFVDRDQDPYNINRGFFYAHIGWVLLEENGPDRLKYGESDLGRDPWIRWQHQHYWALVVVMGFLLPMFLGWALLDAPIGGLLFVGIFRTVFTQHCTFLINSYAHMFGRQPYSDQHTAKDSFALALFSYGEGYHNFHHQFAADYRNGVKWYQWDPTKWTIYGLSLFGLTDRLRRVPASEILKAQMTMDEKRLAARGVAPEELGTLKQRTLEAQKRVKELREEYAAFKISMCVKRDQMRDQMNKKSREHYVRLKADLREAQIEARAAWRQWVIKCRILSGLPAISSAR